MAGKHPGIKNPNPTQEEMIHSNYRYRNDSCNFFPAVHINEIWLPIRIEGIQDWYWVSSYGRVYSCMSACIVRQRLKPDGYYLVSLCAKEGRDHNFLAHRLVAMIFKPIHDPSSLTVNHMDCNKLTNYLENLEWVTQHENTAHAYINNLYRRGEDRSDSVLTNAQVVKICEALEMGYTYYDVCVYANIPAIKRYTRLVSSIKVRYSWRSISKDYKW